ncbi:MAG: hypothetical protein ISR91_08010 [Candidatus Delongbacteria bacterium]|nr:hypothetical protein [Candidatus Delongbacteria bacterium]
MIELKNVRPRIREVAQERPLQQSPDSVVQRPETVEARVYKLKSGFVSHSVYVTMGYIWEGSHPRPIEIFINSKDLTRAAEYAVLTRLISAIFRKASDPTFILEELKSIHDPNGGYIKKSGYVHSFYSEIADVIEKFFNDMKLLTMAQPQIAETVEVIQQVAVSESDEIDNLAYKICPECQQRTLCNENGCPTCMHPDCNYTKCDK